MKYLVRIKLLLHSDKFDTSIEKALMKTMSEQNQELISKMKYLFAAMNYDARDLELYKFRYTKLQNKKGYLFDFETNDIQKIIKYFSELQVVHPETVSVAFVYCLMENLIVYRSSQSSFESNLVNLKLVNGEEMYCFTDKIEIDDIIKEFEQSRGIKIDKRDISSTTIIESEFERTPFRLEWW